MIIPIFIPHKGCHHDCVFCNQKSISGQISEVNVSDVENIINNYIMHAKNNDYVDVAFYGGSFTGIEMTLQREYLKSVKKYVDKGLVRYIRLSTRPDYINPEIIEMLEQNSVKLIELGVQSMDNSVLVLSNRGHTESDVNRAVKMISDSKIDLGIQTMIGLPGDTKEISMSTAKKVIGFNPKTLRIYPTLVIKGTYLEKMYKNGSYRPLVLNEAVDLTSELLKIYYDAKINIIRVGLQPTETVSDKGDIIAGPFHPAFRQLAESRLIRRKIEKKILKNRLYDHKKIYIYTSKKNISNIIGNKRCNIDYFKSKYGFTDIVIQHRNIDDFFIEC